MIIIVVMLNLLSLDILYKKKRIKKIWNRNRIKSYKYIKKQMFKMINKKINKIKKVKIF